LHWGVVTVVVGSLVAACSADPGVTGGASRSSSGAVAPASTAAPEPIAGSTPVTAPDPTGLPSISVADPDVEIGALDNGLRYLVRNNDNPGRRVEMRLVVDAGSVLQDATQDGGAHFLEHMLFNGTEQFPENELLDVLRGFGAAFGPDINAYTNYDETVYALTMPTDDPSTVATGLDVLAQWLSAATIDQAQVEAERGIVLDEWRQRASSTSGRIFEQVQDLFLTGSPYEGQAPIGTPDAIEATDSEPLRRFYDDWYRPDNAAVVVVGDVDVDGIVAALTDRFAPLVERAEVRERPVPAVESSREPQVRILADPDVAEGFAQVTLPLGTRLPVGTPEAEAQRDLLDTIAFDIVATRLANDALRGEAPFDDARAGSAEYVRGFDARDIVVSADGGDLEASTQAVLDELERVRRHGFTVAEVDQAVSTARTRIRSEYDSRDTRQDAAYAEQYVAHVLEEEPIPTAQAAFDLASAVLDRATPETVAFGVVERLASSAPHLLVVAPEAEADDVPSADVFVDQIASVGDREIDPRPEEAAIDGELMPAPEPVAEASAEQLSSGERVSFVAPLLLTFPNGVEVSINRTEIVAGQVAFEARSPGGLSRVADADVAAGRAAPEIVGRSGVATYDPVALDNFVADEDVTLEPYVDTFTEGFVGNAATADLEVLFQLVHLFMTQPRVDPVALEQYVDDRLPLAADPSIDPGYAGLDALARARYDDPRFLFPTVDELDSVTADGVDRVYRDRFADASDFSFAFSGDLDVDRVTELSRQYLGTLPATGRVETVDFVEPPPPAGIVTDVVGAGQGDVASLSLLFTAPASADRRDDVAAEMVQQVLGVRLTDAIREDLGDSYSSFAVVQLTSGVAPDAAVYVSNTTSAELLDDVASAVTAEFDDLRSNGPTDAEYAAANETVARELELYSNPQINDEVLAVLTDPGGNPSLDAFLQQASLVDDIGPAELTAYLAEWLPANQFIDVRVQPR
jgi:zinc protease